MDIKDLTSKEDARDKIKKGVDKLANTVGVTLGPGGRNVIIDKKYGQPVSTKDGVTVAKEINLKDPVENVGAQMIKEAASRTANSAGDGTTTSTVLAQAIYSEGLKQLKAGVNPVELKRGIDKGVAIIVEELGNMSKQVTNSEEIKNVATISANNDLEIGELITTAMDKVGKDGVITVEESKTAETSLEIVEGMQLDRGYISPYLATDQNTMQATLENPVILLYDKKISALKDVLKVLEQASGAGRSILIIAEDVTDEALAGMVVNKVRGLLKVCAVKAPEYGDKRIATMEDLAVLTGGTFVSETKGMKLEKVTLDMLGSARTVTVTKDKCTIVDGAGSQEAIEARIAEIKVQIEKATSDYDKEKLQARLGKLVGGVAILNIGAHTEVEMREKKDRIDDALHATKAAVDEGLVPGGGVALLIAIQGSNSRLLDAKQNSNADQKTGIDIIIDACQAPFNLLMTNAGLTPEVIKSKIQDGVTNPTNTGYDIRNAKVVDMFEAGIIDPTKVTRTALENAASVAGILLTTEAVITMEPKEEAQVDPNMGMY